MRTISKDDQEWMEKMAARMAAKYPGYTVTFYVEQGADGEWSKPVLFSIDPVDPERCGYVWDFGDRDCGLSRTNQVHVCIPEHAHLSHPNVVCHPFQPGDRYDRGQEAETTGDRRSGVPSGTDRVAEAATYPMIDGGWTAGTATLTSDRTEYVDAYDVVRVRS